MRTLPCCVVVLRVCVTGKAGSHQRVHVAGKACSHGSVKREADEVGFLPISAGQASSVIMTHVKQARICNKFKLNKTVYPLTCM